MRKRSIFVLVLFMMICIIIMPFANASTAAEKGLTVLGNEQVRNVALGKPATQSSIGWNGRAARAVDGNRDGRYASNSVMHTQLEQSPWWQVDLQESYEITHISLYNRIEEASRTKNIYVFVSETPFTNNDLNAVRNQPGVHAFHVKDVVGRPTNIEINQRGRYVRVQMAERQYLHLAEVEVYAVQSVTTPSPAALTRFNVALGKPASQSSIGWNGRADRAVDGNRDGRYASNSVMHTQLEQSPWWQVDLQESFEITHISLFNRIEEAARTKNIYVFVSETPFTSNELNAVRNQPGVHTFHIKDVVGRPTNIEINRRGRYVRVQMAERQYLHLAEVEVYAAQAVTTPAATE